MVLGGKGSKGGYVSIFTGVCSLGRTIVWVPTVGIQSFHAEFLKGQERKTGVGDVLLSWYGWYLCTYICLLRL